MAQAKCLNEECDRDDTWELQKHPDEYSRDGPTCPECGTTRVQISGSVGPSSGAQRQGGGGQTLPARQGGGQEQLPAAGATGGAAGAAIADLGLALVSGDADPQERRAAVEEGAGLLGGAVNRVLDHREEQRREQEERARNATLKESPAAVECRTEGCEYVFDAEELAEEQVRCPECNAVWEVAVEEGV